MSSESVDSGGVQGVPTREPHERKAPTHDSAKALASARKWLHEQHMAPCGLASCDSVYCFAANVLADYEALRAQLTEAHASLARVQQERDALALIGAQFANFAYNTTQFAPPPSAAEWERWRVGLRDLREKWDAARAASPSPDTTEKHDR